ncbi:hypothetical protein WOLCODRAFT_90905 [Wolfiporia cocos MD-104 SS10]|uniref:HAT C-terminal dimerisation domain-containing protein n=1 Tax=Wolfiporia cocos (strain MD-104) TaxID=742152 RepID=A0A2H3JX55_WOLCO|nr:hypothetical protein WOLCODRAFT_90905 [Wolfiporia cocos MD-104 SS10]
MSHDVPAGSACVQLEEMDCLKHRKFNTLLLDGWEDISVLAETCKHSSCNCQWHCITAEEATKKMGVDWHHIAAVMTDNPTTMITTFPCFLHLMNTTIGKIMDFSAVQDVLKKTACIISFFNSSHYCGGQLDNLVKEGRVKRSLKTHTETRWYTLVLQLLSVDAYKDTLVRLALRPDAQHKQNGLTPVTPDVIRIVLDSEIWGLIKQTIKICKPLVDAIGNIESQEATLVDCMLELICCTRKMYHITYDDGKSLGFWLYVKAIFNHQFHAMNTEYHSLSLFLHPLCQKLAISQAANGWLFEHHCQTALKIAKQYQYNACKGVFLGAQDGKVWWEGLAAKSNWHPIKYLAIMLHKVVLHAADVERLFSDLNIIQGIWRSRLTMYAFKALGKLWCNYTYHIHEHTWSLDQPICHRHTHMHTQQDCGINIDLATDLEKMFVWKAPLSICRSDSISTEGPESISPDEIEAAFADLHKQQPDDAIDPILEGTQIGAVKIFDLEELE